MPSITFQDANVIVRALASDTQATAHIKEAEFMMSGRIPLELADT